VRLFISDRSNDIVAYPLSSLYNENVVIIHVDELNNNLNKYKLEKAAKREALRSNVLKGCKLDQTMIHVLIEYNITQKNIQKS
jgi:hypothetical protein